MRINNDALSKYSVVSIPLNSKHNNTIIQFYPLLLLSKNRTKKFGCLYTYGLPSSPIRISSGYPSPPPLILLSCKKLNFENFTVCKLYLYRTEFNSKKDAKAECINAECTESPKDFSKKLGISSSTLFNYMNFLKNNGVPIEYSRERQTYHFAKNGKLRLFYFELL